MSIMQGYTGSLVVTPITSNHCGVVGTLNVDSLTYIEEGATNIDTNFADHECEFYKVVTILTL